MWSLGQAYETFPQIEEEFSAALDASLSPRGPDMLFDLVADLGFAPGAVVLDVGCGEGSHAQRAVWVLGQGDRSRAQEHRGRPCSRGQHNGSAQNLANLRTRPWRTSRRAHGDR
jgi:hypothetical protein